MTGHLRLYLVTAVTVLALLLGLGNLTQSRVTSAQAATPNLTGTYFDNTGAIYYVQQTGNTIWWAGFSLDAGLPPDQVFHRGVVFTNIFHGAVFTETHKPPRAANGIGITPCTVSLIGPCIVGDWVDVSRGVYLSSGSLILEYRQSPGSGGSGYTLTLRSQTGGFGPSQWTPTDAMSDLPDMYYRFNHVEKGHDPYSLSGNGIKPFRDQTVFYARVISTHLDGGVAEEVPHQQSVDTVGDPNYKPDRSYRTFICDSDAPNGDDHDIEINLGVDVSRFERKFTQVGWDGRNPQDVMQKLYDPTAKKPGRLTANESYIHAEGIMYGHTTKCADNASNQSLGNVYFPGWADAGGNSILINGRPIDGANANYPNNIFTLYDSHGNKAGLGFGTKTLHVDDQIRITGSLILDCGHGITKSCNEGDSFSDNSGAQNQEIHPIYSIDIIRPPLGPGPGQARPNLTGAWGSGDGGTYYIRQIGHTIWWLGLSRDRQALVPAGSSPPIPTFATVFKGTITDNADGSATIVGNGATVPQSTMAGGQTYSVRFSVLGNHKRIVWHNVCLSSSCPDSVVPLQLDKLYEPNDPAPPLSQLSIGQPQWCTSLVPENCGVGPIAEPPQTRAVLPHGGLVVSGATPFTVSASDLGSGVQNIWYRFYRQGSTPPAFTSATGSPASFTLKGVDGWYDVETYATDNAGNDETHRHTFRVYLDNSTPQIAITQPKATTYTHSATLTLGYSANDGGGAGVATVTPTMDGQGNLGDLGLQTGQQIPLLTSLSLGSHVFKVAAQDHVGNQSARSVRFTIIATAQSIMDDVRQYEALNQMPPGEDTVLLAQLQSAANAQAAHKCASAATDYRTFIHDVQAEGEAITPRAAAVMIADARYVIAHCR